MNPPFTEGEKNAKKLLYPKFIKKAYEHLGKDGILITILPQNCINAGYKGNIDLVKYFDIHTVDVLSNNAGFEEVYSPLCCVVALKVVDTCYVPFRLSIDGEYILKGNQNLMYIFTIDT